MAIGIVKSDSERMPRHQSSARFRWNSKDDDSLSIERSVEKLAELFLVSRFHDKDSVRPLNHLRRNPKLRIVV